MREAKDRRRLHLGIRRPCGRLNVRWLLEQAYEAVDRFPDAARNEMAEQSDVTVGHVVVGDAAIAAVADRVLGEQAVLGEFVLGAVGCSGATAAPDLRQIAAVVGIDKVLYRGLELSDADVAAVGKRQLVRSRQALHVASCLSWAQIAAVREDREDVALDRIGELRLGTGQWPKVPRPARPLADGGEHVENVAFWHAFQKRSLKCLSRCRWLPASPTLEHRLALLGDDDIAVSRETCVNPFGGVGQPALEPSHEFPGSRR